MSTTIASASVKITADISELKAEIEAGVREATGTVSVKVDADATDARAELAEVSGQLDLFSQKDVTAKVGVDTGDTQAKLGLTDTELDKIGSKTVTATVRVKTDGGGKDAEDGISGILTTVLALGPALVPVTAGVVGFGAAAGTALSVVGLDAGVVALAFSAVKKEVTTELTPALNELKTTSADGIMGGVKRDIADLLPELPKVNQLVASLSTETGHLATDAGQGLGGPAFKSFFSYLESDGVPILDEFGHIVGDVTEGAAKLAVGFAPVTAQIGSGLESLASRFASSAASGQSFRDFITYVQTEGPQVASTFGEIGDDIVHVGTALAPVGAATLDIVHGFADIIDHTPAPVIQAVVVGLSAMAIASKGAALGVKAFGLSEEAAEAAAGPLGLALAVGAIALTSYEAQKEKDAETTQKATAATNAYVASLHTIPTSASSVTSSLGALSDSYNTILGRLKAGESGSQFDKDVASANALGAAIRLTTTEGRQAQGNAQSLAAQYGLTTQQVIKLAGGSKELVGSFGTVNARFKTLYQSAEATHRPLSQAAQDEAILGDKASTAAQDVSALSDELNIFAGNALATDAAALQFKDDIATLAEDLKKSKGSLDSNTTAGRAAAEQLNSSASAALATANAAEKQGASIDKVRGILEAEIKSLERTAGGSAAAKTQIDLLKSAYDHIPATASAAAKGTDSNSAQIAKNAKQAAGQASAALGDQVANALAAGQNFSSSFALGIADGQDAAVNAAAKIAAAAIQSVRDTQKSKSPSKVLRDEGGHASTGYALGIVDGTPQAVAAASTMAKKTVDAATSTAKSEAAKIKAGKSAIASIEESLGGTFTTDLAGTPKQIISTLHTLTDRLASADRSGYLSSSTRDALDKEIDGSRKSLIGLSDASKKVTTELGKAQSALSTLRSDAANVRSSAVSSFQSLGDPGQFNAVTSVSGLLSVLGKNVAVGSSFDKNLDKARSEGLDKSAYAALLSEGPAQDSNIAALLATATKAQIRAFNADESDLTGLGTSTGKSSASYLYGKAITEQAKAVRDLHDQQERLRADEREEAKLLQATLKAGLRGAHHDAVALRKAIHGIGSDTAKALNTVASARKQTRRATVAGARTG